MRVNPVPPVPSESVTALRTHLLRSARFAYLNQTGILFNQSQRGMPNKLVWRNAFEKGDLRQPGLLLGSELYFHP
jgi:hypothetical protein